MRLAAFRTSRFLVFFVFFALFTALAVAQSPGEIRLRSAPYTLPAVVLVAHADTVPLTVVVRDSHGKVITGLAQDRFRLSDNGTLQTLTSFHANHPAAAPEAAAPTGAAPTLTPAPSGSADAAPRYVALLFDDVNSNQGDLQQARNAALRFLKEQLGPGGYMALYTVSNSQTLAFTQDRAALAAAIAHISAHPRASARGLAQCPRITPYEAYLIAEIHDPGALQSANADSLSCGNQYQAQAAQDAALRASDCGLNCTFGAPPPTTSDGIPVETQANATWEMTLGVSQDTLATVRNAVALTAQQPGERIVVLASSGFLTEGLEQTREDIIREALRDDVIIDALDDRGLYSGTASNAPEDDRGFLPLITWAFEESTKITEAEAQSDAMASMALATGGLYFHNNNDLTVGFEQLGLSPSATYDLAFTPTPLVRDGKLHRIKIELSPSISGASLEARRGYFAPPPGLTPAEMEQALNQAMHTTATASAVPAEVSVTNSPGTARVQIRVGVTQPRERVSLIAGLFAANGDYITGERGEMDLALKDSTFKKLRKNGLAPAFDLHAPAGQYRLRVVVEDATGALTEINRDVQVP
jgi:VWFA-related protein